MAATLKNRAGIGGAGRMLHTPIAGVSFDLNRQFGELNAIVSSEAGRTYLAEAYTGWPGQKLA